MYINTDVDLPEELITAQREGHLVVFAGAGVSLAAPSNLPGFEDLAEMVSGPTDLTRREDEPPDVFLGRVAQQGVDVETRAREVIEPLDSEPTELHGHLIDLFPTSDDLRIVTTNFDPHFSTLARDRFGEKVEIYCAPALPLGRDAHGVVYLHGSVENERSDLVLTDRDFGGAYLTDGWASRFLRELFVGFTVLFVGYSHEDTIVQYLARGLVPSDSSRYALTLSGNDSHWKRLGIQPVHYPERPEPGRHSALKDAVAAWVEDIKRGALEHEARIQGIVEGDPPRQRDLADYIASAIKEPTRRHFFIKHATTPEWLEWANRKGALDPLFEEADPASDAARDFARWFAQHFAVDHPLDALELVTRRGPVVHPVLWRAIVHTLAHDDPRPPPEVRARWVSVLAQSAPAGRFRVELSQLLSVCSFPEDHDSILVLFRLLTRPTLSFTPLLGTTVNEDEDGIVYLRADVEVVANHHLMSEGWEEVVAPNLQSIHDEIARIIGSQLSEAHQLLSAAGAADRQWDPLSYSRSAIEPHPQNQHREVTDLLIDTARDALESALQHDPDVGLALIARWRRAAAPLLRRLAIHGMAETPDIGAEEALQRIQAKDWLYRSPLKHEVFRLIERTYPHAAQAARRSFIAYSMEADVIEGEPTAEDERTIAYERYNVAVWLTRAAPECQLASDHLERLQAEHDFAPRDHPDLSVVTSGVQAVVPKSPVTVEEMLEMSVAACVDYLLTYEGEERPWEGPSREGLFTVLAEAVEEQPAWSLVLAERVVEQEAWEPDLWSALLRGWNEADLDPDQWARVLRVVGQLHDPLPFGCDIAKLLEDGLENESIPMAMIDAVEDIADLVFKESRQAEDDEPLERDNWLTTAINHVGGRIALVWLNALSRRRAEVAGDWVGLPTEYSERFEAVLDDATTSSQLARVVLASQLSFLHHVDSEWTEARLVPLFDWDRNESTAEQAWHGFLGWGRLNEPLLAQLLPLLQQSFSRLGRELEPHRGPFCRRLAGVAVHSEVHPLESGWLPRFVAEADEDSRVEWASQIGRQLGEMDAEPLRRTWTRWLRSYWRDRVTGAPRPLANAEAMAMLDWALELQPVFAEAVELISRMRVEMEEEIQMLLYRLAESDLPEEHPTPFARLLEYLLDSICRLTYGCERARSLTGRLIQQQADPAVLVNICERMAEFGCDGIRALRDRIRGEG